MSGRDVPPSGSEAAPPGPRPTALAVVAQAGRVLLLEMEEPGLRYWSFPGGGVQRGERLPEAAARETYEETGVQVAVGELLYVHDFINPEDGCHKVEVYFLARPVGSPTPRPHPRRDPRILQVRWWPVAALAQLTLFPAELARLLPEDLKPGAEPRPRYF